MFFVDMNMNNSIIEQFNTLNNSGVLSELGELKQDNRLLKRLIDDSAELLMLTTADSMIEYVSSKFLDYFIPEFMAFIISPPREQSIIQYCFRNVGRVDEWLESDDFFKLKKYYDMGSLSNDFDTIASSLGKNAFSSVLKSKNPKYIFPLKGIGGIFGIAIFSGKVIPGEYLKSEIEYIEHMFKVLSVLIQNDLHYHCSVTDPKTGLFTYDYFVHKVESALAVVHRYGRSAGLLMLDIDFFKKFNDTWGHLAGDKLLVAISSVMSSTLRKVDCICRFGGEEFAVLIPETNAEGLMAVAERLRLVIQDTFITVNGEEVSATVSIGAYLICADEILTARRIFDWADKALYVSKNNGRNQTTLFPDGLLKRAEIHRTNALT